MSNYLDLYDYRCRVARMYRQRTRSILGGEDPAEVCQRFRAQRNELFAHHPQSALDEEQKLTFQGLHYFPCDISPGSSTGATSRHREAFLLR